jgi:hypothetical protein
VGDPREKERKIAEAIYCGLQRRNRGYVVGKPGPHKKTIIDGRFYLMSVARQVLKALKSMEAHE